MTLQPRYTAAASLQIAGSGSLTLGVLTASLQVRLTPFFQGPRGEKGEPGAGAIEWSSLNW